MMGLKFLKSIEDFMRANLKTSYSKTEIRDTLNINYYTVLDVLAYLLKEKKIKKVKKVGEVEKYIWVKK